MRAIERRIERLDEKVADLPCPKPGHGDLMLFVRDYGHGVDPNEQAKIDSIRRCGKCKDKLVIVLWHFGREFPPTPPIAEPTRAIHFEFGDGAPVPAVNPGEIEFAGWQDWLDDKE